MRCDLDRVPGLPAETLRRCLAPRPVRIRAAVSAARRHGTAAALLFVLQVGLFLIVANAGSSDLAEFPDDDVESRIAQVNEGELRFLSEPSTEDVHHHDNGIRITADSLATGWVGLRQCHEHLDPVPASEIVYRPDRIRDLRILEAVGVGASRVDGASVQLEDVRPGARVCVSAETRALQRLPEGGYSLRNGPYLRRFLDGFYPMRVTLEIRYPAEVLRPVGFDPPSQPGFSVTSEPGRIWVDAWFEGELRTRFDFCPLGQTCAAAD